MFHGFIYREMGSGQSHLVKLGCSKASYTEKWDLVMLTW